MLVRKALRIGPHRFCFLSRIHILERIAHKGRGFDELSNQRARNNRLDLFGLVMDDLLR